MKKDNLNYFNLIKNTLDEIKLFLNNSDNNNILIDTQTVNKILYPLNYNLIKSDEEKHAISLKIFNLFFLVFIFIILALFIFDGIIRIILSTISIIIFLVLILFLFIKKYIQKKKLKGKEDLLNNIDTIIFQLDIEKIKANKNKERLNSLVFIEDILFIIKENLK